MPLLSPLATVLTRFGQYPMEAQAPCTGLSHGRLLPRKSKTIITSWPPCASSQRPQPRATVAGNAARYVDAATSGGSDSKDTQRLCPRLTLDFSGWAPPRRPWSCLRQPLRRGLGQEEANVCGTDRRRLGLGGAPARARKANFEVRLRV